MKNLMITAGLLALMAILNRYQMEMNLIVLANL